jgi:hypothetical protein
MWLLLLERVLKCWGCTRGGVGGDIDVRVCVGVGLGFGVGVVFVACVLRVEEGLDANTFNCVDLVFFWLARKTLLAMIRLTFLFLY